MKRRAVSLCPLVNREHLGLHTRQKRCTEFRSPRELVPSTHWLGHRCFPVEIVRVGQVARYAYKHTKSRATAVWLFFVFSSGPGWTREPDLSGVADRDTRGDGRSKRVRRGSSGPINVSTVKFDVVRSEGWTRGGLRGSSMVRDYKKWSLTKTQTAGGPRFLKVGPLVRG